MSRSIEQLNGRAEQLAARSSSRQAAEAAKNAVEALKLRQREVITDFYRVCEERNKAVVEQADRRSRISRSRPPPQAISGARVFEGSSTAELEDLGGADRAGLVSGQAQANRLYTDDRQRTMQAVQRTLAEIGRGQK